VLADWRTAPIDERLRATLAFLEKVTLRPDEVGPADADLARAAGADDQALEEALRVAAVFNTIDRIADAFEFHVPTPAQFVKMGAMLLKRGYR
jgi:alkylhydroperoxidase family enzyme